MILQLQIDVEFMCRFTSIVVNLNIPLSRRRWETIEHYFGCETLQLSWHAQSSCNNFDDCKPLRRHEVTFRGWHRISAGNSRRLRAMNFGVWDRISYHNLLIQLMSFATTTMDCLSSIFPYFLFLWTKYCDKVYRGIPAFPSVNSINHFATMYRSSID